MKIVDNKFFTVDRILIKNSFVLILIYIFFCDLKKGLIMRE